MGSEPPENGTAATSEPIDPNPGPERIVYGDDPSQFGDLWLPAGDGSHPVVVLVHGGFWRTGFGLDLMDALAVSLTDRGIAAWNIEYRRVGPGAGGGGGWPGTFDDAAAATDHLAALPDDFRRRLDLDRVATVGHSAGGHLAAWLAARPQLPAGSPWADPAVVAKVAVPQAGVLDLARCAADGVGGTACLDLLGNADLEGRIGLGSPTALLPLGVPVVAVHGDADRIVPLNQSSGFVDDAVAAGDDASLVAIDGADHFAHLNPDGDAWAAVLAALDTHL